MADIDTSDFERHLEVWEREYGAVIAGETVKAMRSLGIAKG